MGGGLNLGLAILGTVYNAATATGKFKGKPKATNVRALMALTISPIHWATLSEDDIKSFKRPEIISRYGRSEPIYSGSVPISTIL